MLILLLSYFWLMIPAYLANFTPVFFRKINFLNYPVDFKKTFHGQRIFGDNKTFRGFFFGVSFGVLVFYVQKVLYSHFDAIRAIALFDYSSSTLFVGFLLSFGALFFDSVKSFFKRQLRLSPGTSWPPFDQVDYAIGAVLFLSFSVSISFFDSLGIVIFSGILHFISTIFGYYAGLRKDKW